MSRWRHQNIANGNGTGVAASEYSLAVLSIVKELPYDPAIPLPILPKEHCTQMCIAASFRGVKKWEKFKRSPLDELGKPNMVYLYDFTLVMKDIEIVKNISMFLHLGNNRNEIGQQKMGTGGGRNGALKGLQFPHAMMKMF